MGPSGVCVCDGVGWQGMGVLCLRGNFKPGRCCHGERWAKAASNSTQLLATGSHGNAMPTKGLCLGVFWLTEHGPMGPYGVCVCVL